MRRCFGAAEQKILDHRIVALLQLRGRAVEEDAGDGGPAPNLEVRALGDRVQVRAGCATGTSVSCCGAGLCLLTAAAAAGGVGWARRLPATSLAVGPT